MIQTIYGICVATIVCVGGYELYHTCAVHQEFNEAYEKALFKYADKDHNNIITTAEADAFDEDLLKGKNVTLLPNSFPKYKNGRTVPTETVTEWIKAYKPSE